MAEDSLTPEQYKKINDWIGKKWEGGSKCTICHSNDWQIAQHLVAPPLYVGGNTGSNPVGDSRCKTLIIKYNNK